MSGSGARLEPFAPAHLAAFTAMLEDPDVQRFTRVPVPTPATFPAEWLARYEAGRRDGTSTAFAVTDTGDGRFLGVALAPRIDPTARAVELGYVVAPEERGRGVATQALRLLTEWAFASLDPMRVELLISVDNEASKGVAARCGYTYEGTLRSIHVKQDVWADTEVWSRLPTDP
jgi:RimJ/RimL family protein N-acetyltransferase